MKKSIFFISLLSMHVNASVDCSHLDNAADMYDFFFTTVFEQKSGSEEFGFKELEKAEKDLAWQCLLNSAELGECSAIQTLGSFHRYSFGQSYFGFQPDSSIADKLDKRKLSVCGT